MLEEKYHKMKCLSTLAISVFITASVFAQSSADSLHQVWQNDNLPDSVRIEAYAEFIVSNLLRSNPDSAIEAGEELLQFSENKDLKRGMAISLNLIGNAYQYKSDYEKAREYNESSLEIAREIGYQKGIGQALGDIGTTYYNQSQYDQAFAYYQQSLEVRNEVGDKADIANTYRYLGNYYYAVYDYSQSIDYYEKSLNIYRELGDRLNSNRNLFNIAAIYSNQGDYLRALDYYQRSLEITEELEDKAGIGNSLSQLGRVYNILGSYEQALEYHQRSLDIRTELGAKAGVASSLASIGLIYKNLGQYEEAMDYYQRSLVLREEVGDQRRISYCLNNIGEVYYEQGIYNEALDFFQQSLDLKETIGDKFGISYTLNNIGNLYAAQGQPQKALQNCQQAYDISRQIGNVQVQKVACQCLYDVNKVLGKPDEALQYLEQLLIIEDSLESKETLRKIQQIEFEKQMLADSIAQAEKDRRVQMEYQAELDKKNRNRNIAIGAGMFFLLLAGVFFRFWRFTQKSKVIIEEEKERSENLLLNILPAEVAEELKEKGRSQARDHELVSILFTDFEDFTKAAAGLSAQDLVTEINICFEQFDNIVGKYGIEKIKTIGDAYMAAGGLSVPTQQSVKNTVLAALEMQAFITQRKSRQSATRKPAFQMRAGIHTGPVVAGIVGVKKFQYDVWGDTVNTASRMETRGHVDKVNISQATYEYIKEDPAFRFENRGPIKVKGKEAIQMWFVERVGD